MAGNIFSYNKFVEKWGDVEHDFSLVSQDTYDESSVFISIEKIGKNVCLAIGVQLSLIGFGAKSYGFVKVKDELIDIKSFFDKNNIVWNASLHDKLEPSVLTPRRLVRFFRFVTHNYLKTHPEKSSYLFRKYCPQKNDINRYWIFPGAEHLFSPEIKGIEEILISFIQTYQTLDDRLGIKISERILRILYARGFTPEYMEKIKRIAKTKTLELLK